MFLRADPCTGARGQTRPAPRVYELVPKPAAVEPLPPAPLAVAAKPPDPAAPVASATVPPTKAVREPPDGPGWRGATRGLLRPR